MTTRIMKWWRTSPWLNTQTSRKSFILPYLLGATAVIGTLVVGFAQASLRADVIDTQTRANTAAIADINQLTAVNTYIIAEFAYVNCVSKSGVQDTLRTGIDGIYQFLATLATAAALSDISHQIINQQQTYDAGFVPVTVESCGTEPAPPPGISPPAVPGTANSTTTTG